MSGPEHGHGRSHERIRQPDHFPLKGSSHEPDVDELRLVRHRENTLRGKEGERIAEIRATMKAPQEKPPMEFLSRQPEHRAIRSESFGPSEREPIGIARGTTAAAVTAGSAAIAGLHLLETGAVLMTPGRSLGTLGIMAGLPFVTGAVGGYLGKKIGHPVAGTAVGMATGAVAASTYALSSISGAPLFNLLGGLGLPQGMAVATGTLGLGGLVTASALSTAIAPVLVGGGAYLAYRGLKKLVRRRS